ncbi:helix-turn-helix domain-containing protein [Celerinatantimonas sp. MCCC 1A17872]|uniref:helix-turn-helix domain-containing protein n=1 Tax=Celerinatantimonas sp. MCCC 1A17872 TaxID=3177514 RepID=UPI0038CB0589
MSNKDIRSVIERLQIILKVSNNNQLCKALGVNRSTLGNWVSRNSVPYSLCVDVAEQNEVSVDWLLTGEGSVKRIRQLCTQTDQERVLLETYRELDEADRQAIHADALHRKRVKNLEQRLNEIEGK